MKKSRRQWGAPVKIEPLPRRAGNGHRPTRRAFAECGWFYAGRIHQDGFCRFRHADGSAERFCSYLHKNLR
jgi:hypothetical protein